MSKSKTYILSGQELLAVLSVSPNTKPIKWLEISTKLIGLISPAEAALIVKAGFYKGKCSSSRVHYIQELPDPRKPFIPNYHYLDDRGLPLFAIAQDLRSQWLKGVTVTHGS